MKIKLATSQGERDIDHESPTIEYLQDYIMKEFNYATDVIFEVAINGEVIDPYGDIEPKEGDTVQFIDLGGQV